ncbi:hypothetical protein [Thalassobaculum litoreum]|uniref:Uncharacterized protein n=1 Tax=Thalassobaculum litoreum DSM 18839 TaxID=1123362 RepID=A0A8G2BEC4_9PROT|nr:hypothetical protein [Thalassobaculum litoreum]SDF15546.1 hypothetical protein SAMN05660686_00490 [Thalassobaculum litoreum DSM 18839]
MAMLKAKTKPAGEDYIDLLAVPPKPESLLKAEQALHGAVAAREAGQVKHVEAMRLLERQVAGQPQAITRAQADEIGQTLAGLYATEDDAQAALEAEAKAFEDATVARLLDGLEILADTVGERLNELDRLVDPATVAAVEIRQRGFVLPNSLLPRLRDLRSGIENMRRLLNASRRHAKASDGPIPQSAWRLAR